jgi:hypothetical protein
VIINDLINLAKYSELNGAAIKNNDDAIVAFLNLGMIELYSRFPLKFEENVVTLIANETYYPTPEGVLYPISAFSDNPEGYVEPHYDVAINDKTAQHSIFFNSWKIVEIPKSIEGTFVSILYALNPNYITKEQALDGITTIDIPTGLIDCLLSYIGYRAHIGIKNDAGFESSSGFKRFEFNCKKAEDLGVVFPVKDLSMGKRLFNKGFL